MSLRSCTVAGLAILVIGGPCPRAFAAAYNACGPYVQIAAAYNAVASGFDGKGYFASDEELMLVPRLDPGTGWSAAVGWRWSANAFEISYCRSVHDCSYLDTALSTASYNLVDLNFKHFYQIDRRFQPYFSADFGVPGWFGVKQGSFSTATGLANGDLSYTGLVLGGGGGVAYHLTPRFAVIAGAAARWFWITDLNTGAGVNWQVSGLSAFSPAAVLGMTYVF